MNLSCSFDPIIALLFFMVITATNISSINIHQTFHAHTQEQAHTRKCTYSALQTNLYGKKKSLTYDFFQLLHTQPKVREYMLPSLLLPLPLWRSVSWHWRHLGGIMGKCRTSRITVYLLSSPRLTSPRLSSSSYSGATQPNHALSVYWLNGTLAETKHTHNHKYKS